MTNLRFQVVEEAFKKKPLEVKSPAERPSEYFGKYVFTRDKMYKYLSRDVYVKMTDVIDKGVRLDRSIADAVAKGIRQWAEENGVTHYTHWFQPLTEGTAEKHDAFVILSGGFGGRFDHAFSLLYALVGTNLHGCIADDCEFLLILRDEDAVTLHLSSIPKSISLLPLSPVCSGVSIDGVHWPLTGATLRQHEPYAISNRLSSSDHRIAIKNGKGILALYLCWDEAAL